MMGITEYTVADIFDYIHRVITISNLVLSFLSSQFLLIVLFY